VLSAIAVEAFSGPYKQAGIAGYVGDDRRHADPGDGDAVLNPVFKGWASGYVNYLPSPGVSSEWLTPEETLGPATGDVGDIATLGELDQSQIDQGVPPGEITLTFGLSGEPNDEPIRDVNGWDFVVFENGLFTDYGTQLGFAWGDVFAELGYVEVSTDGEPNHFVRFPGVSLTAESVWAYGTIDMTNVYNLAGKHPNGYSVCTSTPFDLSELAEAALVLSNTVDLNDIKYVRIVDIPGSGDFYDDANCLINPYTWSNYTSTHPIYDAWPTWGSGGFDLEAIGVLNEQNYSADINLDGVVDTADFCIFTAAWLSEMGDENYNPRCDLAEPKDYVIDDLDLVVFTGQWLGTEEWAWQ